MESSSGDEQHKEAHHHSNGKVCQGRALLETAFSPV